ADNGGDGIELANSIVSDCAGSIISLGHNLLLDGTNCAFPSAAGDRVGSSASPIDARLGRLQNNGGPTRSYALLPGSPAIDSGDPASCAGSDQRGVARPQGAACDIGAYETANGSAAVVPEVEPNNTIPQANLLAFDQAGHSARSGVI